MKNILKKSIMLICILEILNLVGCNTEDTSVDNANNSENITSIDTEENINNTTTEDTTSMDIEESSLENDDTTRKNNISVDIKECPAEDFEYTYEGDHIVITSYNGNNVNVGIPSEIDGLPVTIIDGLNSNIVTLSIPDSVISINDCIQGYQNLTTVIFGNGITSITYDTLSYCQSLQNVYLGNSITEIGEYAFSYNDSLQSIDIPDNVTTIGGGAFSHCENLKTINIGKNVSFIESYPFNYDNNLLEINVDNDNQTYYSVDGVLYSKDMTTLIKYPTGKTDTSFIIPDTVTTISEEAFLEVNNLQITMSSNINMLDNCIHSSENITIICPQGSIAEEFAKQNNISYKYN